MASTARRTIAIFVVGAATGGLLVAGIAAASIPSSSGGIVSACVNRATGATRIIDTEARRRCTSAERLVTWARNTPRGTWSSRTTYAAGDLVQHAGSTWQAKTASRGRTPVSGRYWTLLAAAGATGPQGAPGAPGAVGARGPSDAYRAVGPGTTLTTTDATVLAVAVPAGSYAVTASLWAFSTNTVPSGESLQCSLVAGGLPGAYSVASLPDPVTMRYVTLSLTDVVSTAGATTIEVRCLRQGAGGQLAIAATSRLTALQVATVH